MITREGKAYKVTTVTDITAQKQQFRRLEQAVAEKEVLLREVHHRVKNNLNTITSLLTLQQQANETDRRLGQILTDSISRIRTMSTIYDRLHRSGELTRIDMKGYLSELATSLVSAAGRPRDILQTNIEEIEVDIDTGIAIGLISNELVSNSLKYGVSEDGADEVSLDFRVTPAELKLTVGDNGSGFPADFDIAKLNSLGLQLIQAVTMQHGGNIEIVRNAPPLIEVRFPRRTSAR
jgi:two-component sensor histidine kinase